MIMGHTRTPADNRGPHRKRDTEPSLARVIHQASMTRQASRKVWPSVSRAGPTQPADVAFPLGPRANPCPSCRRAGAVIFFCFQQGARTRVLKELSLYGSAPCVEKSLIKRGFSVWVRPLWSRITKGPSHRTSFCVSTVLSLQ